MSTFAEAYHTPARNYQANTPSFFHDNKAATCTEEEMNRTPTQSDAVLRSSSKKRRRGMIEKRRRDRINECLAELKRLVPSAVEKHSSQKLEKAEILQLTVDHLRFIHSSGTEPVPIDTQRLATEYLLMGFRECSTEVARYLSAVEGLDDTNHLRCRLLAHLQYYGSQWAAVASHLRINTPLPYSTPPWSTTSSMSTYGMTSGGSAVLASLPDHHQSFTSPTSSHGTFATPAAFLQFTANTEKPWHVETSSY